MLSLVTLLSAGQVAPTSSNFDYHLGPGPGCIQSSPLPPLLLIIRRKDRTGHYETSRSFVDSSTNYYAESTDTLSSPRLLDKLAVVCPHGDSCTEVSQRGILEDHLRWKYLMIRVKIFTFAMLGTGARGRWWPASTRGRAAPSGGPTRRCGSTRQTAPSRKRVSSE